MSESYHPWSQLGPVGASLAFLVPEKGPATASTGIERPPCEEHELVWTGFGFPRHPVYLARVCVRCWNVLETQRRDDW